LVGAELAGAGVSCVRGELGDVGTPGVHPA